MDWSNLFFIAFGAFVGAQANSYFQRRSKRSEAREEGRFRVYMMLLDLYSRHHWIASADIHLELASVTTRVEFHRQCWRVADELRKIDTMPETEEILRTMFSLHFENEIQRANALSDLLDRLGKKVNPQYAKVIKQISKENISLMAKDPDTASRRQKKIEGSLLETPSGDSNDPDQ